MTDTIHRVAEVPMENNGTMVTVPAYTEAAEADGTWTCPVRLPATPFDQVQDELSTLARDSGWSVAAFCYGTNALVTELLLHAVVMRAARQESAVCRATVEALKTCVLRQNEPAVRRQRIAMFA